MSPYNASDVRKGHKLDRTSGQYFDDRASWISNDPVLPQGQIALESDSSQFKVGDGNKRWSELSYQGAGPHVAWVTPTKIAFKDIAKDKLIAHKDVVCHINQSPARDLSDLELSSPAWQPNTQYEIGDVVSLASGEGLAPGYHHFALSRDGDQYYAHLDGEFLTNQTEVIQDPFTTLVWYTSNGDVADLTEIPLGLAADSEEWTNRVEGTFRWLGNNRTPESLGITWTVETDEGGNLYLQLSDPIPAPPGLGATPNIEVSFPYVFGSVNVFKLLGTQSGEGFDNETRFSGVHLVKGQSLYTSANFTPPAGPIQPNNNSVLLLNVASEVNKLVDATGRHTVKVLATDARGQELSEVDPEIIADSGRNYLVLPNSVPPSRNFNQLNGLTVTDPSSFTIDSSLDAAVNNSIKLLEAGSSVVIPPSLYTINDGSFTRKFARFLPNSYVEIVQNPNITATGDFGIEFWYLRTSDNTYTQAFRFDGGFPALGFTHIYGSQMMIRGLYSTFGAQYFNGPQKDYLTESTHIAIARQGVEWRIWVDGQIALTHTASEIIEFSSNLSVGIDTHPESGGSLLRDFSLALQAPSYFNEDSFEPTIVASPEGKSLLIFSDQEDLLFDASVNNVPVTLIGAASLGNPLVQQYQGSSIVFDESLVELWWPEGVGEQSFDLYWQTATSVSGPAYGANYDVRLTTEDPSEDFSLTGDFTFEMFFYAGELGAEQGLRAQPAFGGLNTSSDGGLITVVPQPFEWTEYRHPAQAFNTYWAEAFNIAISVDGEPLAESSYSVAQGVDAVSIVFAEPVPADTEFTFDLSWEYLDGAIARADLFNQDGFVATASGSNVMSPLTWPEWQAPAWDQDLWMAYRPCVIEVEADREINWSQAVQEGRVQINDNFFALYMGRVQFYDSNADYRYGDVALEPHEDPEALGVPSGEIVYQFRMPANPNYTTQIDDKRGPVFLWDDIANKVTAYQRNPDTDEEWPVDLDRANYILKEIDGDLTLWSSAWFYQVGGLSGNTLPLDGDENNNWRFDGNMHWRNLYSDSNNGSPEGEYSALKRQLFVLPFDGAIPDGARLHFPASYSLYNRWNRILRLGFNTWSDESFEGRGGHESSYSVQGVQVYWHRYLGMWTHENT